MSYDNFDEVAQRLRSARGLLVVTGAGMSVASGVPVFRMADGSMSEDFLRFLSVYNAARVKHGLSPADDWFEFSVPDMFKPETEREAWQYWRWRILRALVDPADDYRFLNKIIEHVGIERSFVVTSNCDMLHVRAGAHEARVREIHGSLGLLQCSVPCSQQLYPVDNEILDNLRCDSEWVPRCPLCKKACLRPNVMIFGDHALIDSHLDDQEKRYNDFRREMEDEPIVVLEIGAGTVVSSIRHIAERRAAASACLGLVRINPSQAECEQMETPADALEGKYFPIVEKSTSALKKLCEKLSIDM